MSWVCETCGQSHADLPFSFAADYPDNYANMSLDQRDLRAVIGSDQCIIDQAQFYIRGCLEIPILNTDQVFLWGLWALLWEADFDEIDNNWDKEGRESHVGPFKGRLANQLSAYDESTFMVPVTVTLRPVATRPLFFVDDPDHPLGIAQRNGMTIEQAQELASELLHFLT